MVSVVLLPSEEGGASARRLAWLLRRAGRVSLCCEGEWRIEPGADFWVLAAQSNQRIVLGEQVITLCLSAPPQGMQLEASGGYLLLAEGVAIPQGMLPKQVISVGRGNKNTVTVSSVQPDRAMIAVQRPLCTLDGKQLEPGEYPVPLPEGFGIEEALAAVVILLLAEYSSITSIG